MSYVPDARQQQLTDPAPWTRLVRSGRGGATIHLRGCKRATSRITVGWIWAEGRNDAEWQTIPWFRACKLCFPAEAAQP